MIEAINHSVHSNASRQLNENLQREVQVVCPECGGSDFNYDHSTYETLCVCGCVIEENILDASSSYLGYTRDGERKNHSGLNKLSVHDKGLSTFITESNHGISENNRFQFYRLRKLQRRSRVNGNKERNLVVAFNKLAFIKSQMHIPKNVHDESARLYRKALNDNLIHGRSIDGMMASCVYIAYKQARVPRNFKEVSEASGVKSNTIANYSRLLTKHFNLKFVTSSPKDYIPRFVSNLGLSNKVEIEALGYIYELEGDPVLIGKSAASFAAAAIYLACKNLKIKKSQKVISECTNVSEVTIRKRYKDIKSLVC